MRGKNSYKHWERKEKKNHSNFRTPTKECLSDCNYRLVHRWIGLSFQKKILHMWYLKLFSWIVKSISGGRNKYFVFSFLYFEVSSFCLYCINWRFVLIWLFVTCFTALIGDSHVSLLIIVNLFLWSGRSMIFTLAFRVFPC